MGDLRKCSRCRSTKLESYFSYNVKGELFKTCDKCRTKCCATFQKWLDKPLSEQFCNCECGGRYRYKAKHLETRQHQEYLEKRKKVEINVARQRFINDVIDSSGGELEYEGIVDPEECDFPSDKLKPITGKELTVEYHVFNMKSTGIPILHRWRLNE